MIWYWKTVILFINSNRKKELKNFTVRYILVIRVSDILLTKGGFIEVEIRYRTLKSSFSNFNTINLKLESWLRFKSY